MNANTLMNQIKAKDEAIISNCLVSIKSLQVLIANYEAQILQAEQAYDLNFAAEIKYGRLKNAKETLVQAKTMLLKTICNSAYQVIDSL